MLLSCNQIISYEMVEHLGFDNSLKNFAGDAGEAYWPITSGLESTSIFEDRSYVGRFP